MKKSAKYLLSLSTLGIALTTPLIALSCKKETKTKMQENKEEKDVLESLKNKDSITVLKEMFKDSTEQKLANQKPEVINKLNELSSQATRPYLYTKKVKNETGNNIYTIKFSLDSKSIDKGDENQVLNISFKNSKLNEKLLEPLFNSMLNVDNQKENVERPKVKFAAIKWEEANGSKRYYLHVKFAGDGTVDVTTLTGSDVPKVDGEYKVYIN
ncbi:hypothetical protein [Mycoplasma struthionis]|uniref:Variable surface lipoprotein n=1 Tax=Mycoplasma struthionis TaxID=538220 RepID=A0A502MIV8_9MOLU|nr:hypothetical protein [Mycoplasma struthionis]TPI01954.1 hypothetical protein FJM01_01730 [Mycoplasma struthionis]